ncbi:hypothetical protein BMD_3289 [Priestia megaterium DSM 319]|uniref:Uncharacterized protein n=1 Tax=Priestia megaterium (strain DSM 319 / IMG 1521) TaxID=592022 RepID=D5DIF7_PRIM3|nr:hypothetical protein BMD_3289 [Priestia megaterium DSM 319]
MLRSFLPFYRSLFHSNTSIYQAKELIKHYAENESKTI